MVYYGDLHRHPVEVNHAPDDFGDLGGSDALINRVDEVMEGARWFPYEANGVAFLREVLSKDLIKKEFMMINTFIMLN